MLESSRELKAKVAASVCDPSPQTARQSLLNANGREANGREEGGSSMQPHDGGTEGERGQHAAP